jgi:hypothetical protein
LHSSKVVVEKIRTPTPLALNQVNEEYNQVVVQEIKQPWQAEINIYQSRITSGC